MEIMKQDVLNELKHFSLLFVEDDKSTLKFSEFILKDIFKNITFATNGEEAIDIFKNKSFDLVITDIVMPKIDGFGVVEFIKKYNPDTFVLILSSYFDTDTLLKAIDVNVDGFLVKPFDLNIFINTMMKLLNYKLRLDEEINLLKQYKDIVDESLIVSKTDPKGIITYVNKAFEEISGFKKEELLGKRHNIIRHSDVKDEVFKEVWQTITNKQAWKGIIKNRKKNGEAYYVESVIKPILNRNGEIIEYIALRKDITKYISAEKLINDKLKTSIKDALLALIKIDSFNDMKLIYDEDILRRIKRKLINRVKNLFKNHFDGIEEYSIKEDIFGFLIEQFNKGEIIELMLKLEEDINNYPIIVDDFEYYPFIRISFSCEGEIYENAIIGLDEIATTETKAICANNLSQKRKEETFQNMKMLKTIKYALQNHKVISLFQAIVSNKTQKPIKYESLVRIIDENGKIISPFFFLDIAKKAGIYGHITKQVLENSFKVYKTHNIPISINLSPSDIVRDSIRNTIIELLKKYTPKKGMITFELLEDEVIHFPTIISAFIKEVKQLNVDIAIDDFGEGYSNFTRVADFQADWIKIDGSLIKDIDKDKTRQDVVEAIVNFAKKENKKTVAEFVENEKIFETIKKLGIDYSQGYYFYKPLEIQEIIKN